MTTPVVEWIRQNPIMNTVRNDNFSSIESDASGNIYVAYSTEVGTASGQSNTGFNDIVVFKMNPNGDVEWVRQNNIMNTYSPNIIPSISVDKTTGDVYVAYYTFRGTASGQSNTGNSYDIIVFKMNSSGIVQWVTQNAIMNTIRTDVIADINTDAYGNVYVSYETNLGTASGQSNTGNSRDIVVFKMNSSGIVQWVKQNAIMNTILNDRNTQITTDAIGNIYVTYYTDGSASGQNNIGNNDIVVFKMNSSGIVEWVKQNEIMNTVQIDNNPSIATDANGNIYVTYYTTGSASGQNNIGSSDIVVFKMNTTGSVEWVKQNATMNTILNELEVQITADANGNIYVTYYTAGSASGQNNIGNDDIVVFKMNSSGIVEWVIQNATMNTVLFDFNPTIDTDASGNIYVAYFTAGSASGQNNIGSSDIVVFKLRQIPNMVENNFVALLQDYITLGPTLVFTPEYVTALRDGTPIPTNAFVDWMPPTGLPVGTPLRDLKKSIVIMQNRLHTYRFRYMQENSGPDTEGVGLNRCGYVCTWAASGQAYLP